MTDPNPALTAARRAVARLVAAGWCTTPCRCSGDEKCMQHGGDR